MRTVTRIGLLTLALAAPALAQTPATETVTFEDRGTPMAFESEAPVPESARVKKISLSGGGYVKLRTRDGAKYAALVTTHLGTTAIVGVSKKGKIQPRRLLDIRIRKSKGAAFDSFTPINMGVRIDDNGTTTTRFDDQIAAYDGPGVAQFRLYDTDGGLQPITGNLLILLRSGTTKAPYDLTTTSLDFNRIQIVSDGADDFVSVTEGASPNQMTEDVPNIVQHMAYDDLVVSYGH